MKKISKRPAKKGAKMKDENSRVTWSLRPDSETKKLVESALKSLPGIARQELIFEVVRQNIGHVVSDIIEQRKKAAESWKCNGAEGTSAKS